MTLPQLDDESPMPYGRHKGSMMRLVPAAYLHWLWCAGLFREYDDPVARYIRNNLKALQTEHPDGIWSND